MDDIRFNQLVDKVRIVRSGNKTRDVNIKKSINEEQSFVDILTIQKNYDGVQTHMMQNRSWSNQTIID